MKCIHIIHPESRNISLRLVQLLLNNKENIEILISLNEE